MSLPLIEWYRVMLISQVKIMIKSRRGANYLGLSRFTRFGDFPKSVGIWRFAPN